MDKKTKNKKEIEKVKKAAKVFLGYFSIIIAYIILNMILILTLIPRNDPYYSLYFYFFITSDGLSFGMIRIFTKYNNFLWTEQEKYDFIYFLHKEKMFNQIILLIVLNIIISFTVSYIIFVIM